MRRAAAEAIRHDPDWNNGNYDKNPSHYGDPNRLYIGGQSSGGHLAAVALTTDWQRQFNLPADIIKGGMCISGMYDLCSAACPPRQSPRRRSISLNSAKSLEPAAYLARNKKFESIPLQRRVSGELGSSSKSNTAR
jgi:hypothetical protein